MSHTRSYPKDKSPLHPSALRIQDLNPGVKIVKYNRTYGLQGEYTVVSRPFVGYLGTQDGLTPEYMSRLKDLVVVLKDRYGKHAHSLGDLGVTPCSGGWWNDANFVISARKRHLLPEPPPRSSSVIQDDWEDYLWDELEDGCRHEVDPYYRR